MASRTRRQRISAAVSKVQRGPGRPMEPTATVTKDALWKRAQRADGRPPNRDMIRHHVDHSYGRTTPQTKYMSRAEHNRIHAKVRIYKKRRRRKAAA